jgi:hypothetical protein
MILIFENEVKLTKDEQKRMKMLIDNVEKETLYTLLRIVLNKLKRGKVLISQYTYVDVITSNPLIMRFLNNNTIIIVYVFEDVIKIQVFSLCS